MLIFQKIKFLKQIAGEERQRKGRYQGLNRAMIFSF